MSAADTAAGDPVHHNLAGGQGNFNPSIRPASVVADALVALYNPQLAAWSLAPAANEIERLALRTVTKALGLNPENVLANFTSGGAEANFSAVLAALIHRFAAYAEDGLAEIGARPIIYVTSESHHSFIKIARMAGLGTKALHQVPLAHNFILDVDALERQIETDLLEGWLPLMVVGTAGATGAGLIDPLPSGRGVSHPQTRSKSVGDADNPSHDR